MDVKRTEHDCFTISGEMKGTPKGVVKLYTKSAGKCVLLDSCEVKDGKYFWKGKHHGASVAGLLFDMESQSSALWGPRWWLYL